MSQYQLSCHVQALAQAREQAAAVLLLLLRLRGDIAVSCSARGAGRGNRSSRRRCRQVRLRGGALAAQQPPKPAAPLRGVQARVHADHRHSGAQVGGAAGAGTMSNGLEPKLEPIVTESAMVLPSACLLPRKMRARPLPRCCFIGDVGADCVTLRRKASSSPSSATRSPPSATARTRPSQMAQTPLLRLAAPSCRSTRSGVHGTRGSGRVLYRRPAPGAAGGAPGSAQGRCPRPAP